MIDVANVPEKKKLLPKDDVEYIFIDNNLYTKGKLGPTKTVDDPIIVTDVRFDGDFYDFTVKETGEKYRSYYGWAFREYTPENLIKIREYNELKDLANHAAHIASRKRDEIMTLEE